MPGKNIPCPLRDNILVGECAFLVDRFEWYFSIVVLLSFIIYLVVVYTLLA